MSSWARRVPGAPSFAAFAKGGNCVGSEEEALRDTECVRQAIEELGENAPLSKIVERAQKLKLLQK